jgi:hypothetical protein
MKQRIPGALILLWLKGRIPIREAQRNRINTMALIGRNIKTFAFKNMTEMSATSRASDLRTRAEY